MNVFCPQIFTMPPRTLVAGLVLATTCLANSSAASALTVRVDPAGGAPRLVVNGKPVRGRVFFGSPGSPGSPVPVPVSPDWRDVDFEFVASCSATNGTMHFRFDDTPGDVDLDDIHVDDRDGAPDLIQCDFEGGPASFSADWFTYQSDETHTVGTVQVEPRPGCSGRAALHLTLKSPPDGNWRNFHIYHNPQLVIHQGHRYHVHFRARSEPARNLTVAFYRPGPPWVLLGPPDCFQTQIKLAAEAGVDLVSFLIDMPWPEPGQAVDWSRVDGQCETVLCANPKALLLPRMVMDPPSWWCQKHPDDVMQWEDEDGRRTDAKGNVHAVVASPSYRHDAAQWLKCLVTHLEEKFGDHMAGYHPCGQNTGEWFYRDTWEERHFNGYAPADLAAWRQWLKQRYASDKALRQAWKDTTVTRDSALVPSPKARLTAPAGIFRDPATERSLIDWAKFQQEAMADCICELAHAARQASQCQKLVVFFYGYVFEFGACGNAPSTAGHYALQRVLNCPDIDVLCSPISYFDRGLGQSAPSMTAAESAALAGKLWLNEDDTYTYLASGKFPGMLDAVYTLEDTNKELVRNVAQEALRNFATWWMDLGATGWFNDSCMWAKMEQLKALDEPLLKTPTPFRPEVAAVIDEQSMLRVAAQCTRVTKPGINGVRAPLGRMGAPHGQYLLDDVVNDRVPAKMYVFLNAWCLSPYQRAKLQGLPRGAARVWCYAPGYFEEDDRASLDAMQQLTGFTLKEVTLTPTQKGWAEPTAAGKRAGIQYAFGTETPPRPLFAAVDVDATVEILATYPDGSAAVAMRHMPEGGLSVFVGAPLEDDAFDLSVMPPVNDVNIIPKDIIPKEGKNLIIVAKVNNVLYVRIFDHDGTMVINTDEKRLTAQDEQIEDLKKRLWPPDHQLTSDDKVRVIHDVILFVGYIRVGGLTSELLRTVARASGVHLFTETDCNVYANGRFLAVHASKDGQLEIDVGQAGPISDVLTGARIGNGPRITLPLKQGETRVLQY